MSHTTTIAAGNFLIPDATFIAEIVAFLLILAVMRKYVVPPLQRSVTSRQAMIRQQIEDSRDAKERLEAAEAEVREALAEARNEALRTREDAQRTRQELIAAAKEEARVEAEAVTRRAEERMAVERRQVLTELRREIGQIAVELAERVVGESLSDDDRQRRVVDRFLSELEGADTAGATAGGSGEQP